MNITVGSAPDSWGVWFPSDSQQTPWHRFMDEIVEAGYEWTELGPYGYLPTDLPTLGRELSSRGLKVTGTFAMANVEEPSLWGELERQVLGAGERLAALDAKYLVLIDDTYTDLFTGEAIAPKRLDESAWGRFIETTHKVADLAREKFGLQLVFHPHAETHVEYEDQIEAFLEQTDPDRVSICFDTGHHAYRGGDPINFMRRHYDRIPYLHLKSIDTEIQKRVEAEGIPFAEAVKNGYVRRTVQRCGGFFLRSETYCRRLIITVTPIVEQDMYPAPFDKPLPIAKRTTREYLREIGIG